LRSDHKAGTVRLCFGSKKLFRAQFDLVANDYADHVAWHADWQARRAQEFALLGSKDETSGNQSCTASVGCTGAITLRLRLPDALAGENHDSRYLALSGISFAYGQEPLFRALAGRQAISYRFVGDSKGWMPLYFSYGSNMDVAAMRIRCPTSQLCGRAELSGHRFFIMGDGYASIARDSDACVHGVMWQVGPADVAALDQYEEVSSGLYVKRMGPILFGGNFRRALFYCGRSRLPGKPRAGYMETIIAAAAAADLPIAYQGFLAGFRTIGIRGERRLGEPAD
jgi:gamma-glutamylcyclotransferase (GGCT)/AIG2-like uncharacterized protein YtfP